MNVLGSARAPSTTSAYEKMWKIFSRWCEEQSLCPESCSINSAFLFLRSLYDAGCAASTLKVYTAALSACHNGGPDGPLGKHPLLTRSPERCSEAQATQPFPSWDLYIVLEALTKAPFEPLELIDLKHLSL